MSSLSFDQKTFDWDSFAGEKGVESGAQLLLR